MSIQYISDSEGNTTGVFIPINEWNDLKIKYEGLDQEEMNNKEDQYDPDFVARIEESREQYKKGEFISVEKKDINSFLGLE